MIIILKTQITPPHIRGYLRRFLSEVDTNLFVGKCSRRVIDKIWERIKSTENEDFRAKLILPMNVNEMGFEFYEHNPESFRGRSLENDEILLFDSIEPQKTT